ncbi:MAG: hypothetical protein PHH77_04335 [Victivallaceae bacterium]|nr:hypothetical protein [Victivallaceae bacterium]
MRSIYVDWFDENIERDWDFIGAAIMYHRESLRLERCPHGNRNLGCCQECECFPDERRSANMPMMNFAYPLEFEPSEDIIYRVCNETNCTVVRQLSSDIYFLALTGGGMDLSQDVALAYIIADGCIEWDMLENIYISGAFSVSEENYQLILRELKRQLVISIGNQTAKLKEVIRRLKN